MKSFYVGVKAIIENDGKVLLLKRSVHETHRPYFWDVPGGKIDDDEMIEETLKREVAEEIGFSGELHIKDIIHAVRLSHDVAEDRGLVLLYYKVSAHVSEVILGKEHSEFRWVAREDIPAFMEQEKDFVMSGEVRKAVELSLQ